MDAGGVTYQGPIGERGDFSTASADGEGEDEDHDLCQIRIRVVWKIWERRHTEVPPSRAADRRKLWSERFGLEWVE
jgi:hypothetical protein